jgi:hypothetical protein
MVRRSLLPTPAVIVAAAAATLAGCGITVEDDGAPGIRTIRTYISGPPDQLQFSAFNHPLGIEGARLQNEWMAQKRCPEGFVLFKNAVELDADGVFLRWDVGCRES